MRLMRWADSPLRGRGDRRVRRLRLTGAQARERGKQIGEALALNEDVLAQALGRQVRIAVEQGFDDLRVLVERGRHAVADPELEPSVRTQPPLQRYRLLGKKAAVGSAIDGVMEMLVFAVVVIGIGGEARCFAGAVRGEELSLIRIGHPPRGQSGAHRLELAHDLEHLEQALRRHVGDDRAAARSDRDDAHRRELDQRLAQRRPGDTELLRELSLVEPHSRRKGSGRDLVLDRLAQRLGAGGCASSAFGGDGRSPLAHLNAGLAMDTKHAILYPKINYPYTVTQGVKPASFLHRLFNGKANRPGSAPSRATVRGARRAIELCHALMSERGEVSGARLAREALAAYEMLEPEAAALFFDLLAEEFSPDPELVGRCAQAY